MLLTISFTGCNKECNCYNYFTPLPLSEKYFRYYKDENQSWVYVNRQGTKKDSIYLTYDWYDSYNGPEINTTTCNISYSWNMILHSKYLLKDTVSCHYSSGGVKKNGGILWWNTNFSLNSRYFLDYYYRITSEYGIEIMEICNSNEYLPYIKQTHIFPNLETYNDVISIEEKLWFAPDVGLVQFVSYNKVDTFYLQKFYRNKK